MKTLMAFVLLLIASVQGLCAQDCGPVILVGGGAIPPEAITKLQECKKGDGRFLVVSYSESQQARWQMLNPIFALPEKADSYSLSNVCGIIIEGGDQWIYLNKLSAKYIQSAHEQGIPILGTSAGSMILGEHYFTAERDSITSEQAKQNINVCLGNSYVKIKWLKGKIVDTHYVHRDRKGRLEVFVNKSGADCGYGIDEQTALFLDSTHFDILGEGSVAVVKGTMTASALPVNESSVAIAK